MCGYTKTLLGIKSVLIYFLRNAFRGTEWRTLMWLRLIIRAFAGHIGSRAASAGTQTKIGTVKRGPAWPCAQMTHLKSY